MAATNVDQASRELHEDDDGLQPTESYGQTSNVIEYEMQTKRPTFLEVVTLVPNEFRYSQSSLYQPVMEQDTLYHVIRRSYIPEGQGRDTKRRVKEDYSVNKYQQLRQVSIA